MVQKVSGWRWETNEVIERAKRSNPIENLILMRRPISANGRIVIVTRDVAWM